ncbi:SDR family NAD(P)-dependent oxidoreductase [Nonomuraea sp. NPDC052116]|uniref:SDR family NAD(P)-dependent oxidoreductase n=1 Tax=Nonomuraea sp. NPDC052116 TaxID=3155665 RepID=UPI00341402D8
MSKVWFVTGSSRGLGRNFVEAALSRGDKVAATARTAASLDELVTAYGDAVLPLEMDVTDKAAVFESVKRAKEHFGRLDVKVGLWPAGGFRRPGRARRTTRHPDPADRRRALVAEPPKWAALRPIASPRGAEGVRSRGPAA